MSRFWTDDNGVEWVEFGKSACVMKVSRLRKEPQWADLEHNYNEWKEPPKPVEVKSVEVQRKVHPQVQKVPYEPPPVKRTPPAAKPAAKKVVHRTVSTQSRSKKRRR